MSYHSGQDPEENLPDWLKALRKRQSEGQEEDQGEGTASSGQGTGEEEPAWLSEIRQRYGQPERKPQEPQMHEERDALSDTQPVKANRSQETLEPEQPVAKHEAFLEEPEPPDEPVIEEQPAFEETGAPEETVSKTPRRDFPDWLQELGKLETKNVKEPEQSSHIPAFSEGTEDITPGELPSWLKAIRPNEIGGEKGAGSEEIKPDSEAPENEERVGPLAGLSGVLPAEAIQAIKPPVYTARLELTDSQSQHVAALTKILEEEGQPKEDHHRQTVLPARLLITIMSAALLLAVFVPMVSQNIIVHEPEVDILPESAEVFNQIEVLPAEAPVLIAFDLQPALYGETKAVVSALLTHLLDKSARLVFISTQPTGPALVERILQEEEAPQPAIATGDYTNLGYLSGGMAALRSFLSDPRSATYSVTALGLNPWTSPALESIQHISDFAMVIVVSGNAEDVRMWIEQGTAELSNGFYAATSAQAAPLLAPYFQSQPRILKGLVSGIQGATFYERLRAQNGEGHDLWSAYSFGLGAITLIILLGGLYGRVIHMRPEQPRPATPAAPEKVSQGK